MKKITALRYKIHRMKIGKCTKIRRNRNREEKNSGDFIRREKRLHAGFKRGASFAPVMVGDRTV